MVSKREEILGAVPFQSLPPLIRREVLELRKSRRNRLAIGAILPIVLGHSIANGRTFLDKEVFGAYLANRFNKDVQKRTANAGELVAEYRGEAPYYSHPAIEAFLKQGATHVLVDRKLNVHFVKAPKYEGKVRIPFVGRMRVPIDTRARKEK